MRGSMPPLTFDLSAAVSFLRSASFTIFFMGYSLVVVWGVVVAIQWPAQKYAKAHSLENTAALEARIALTPWAPE